jgi:hypothetical protein
MNITYHFIGIHRHRHPSVKKLPFLPSIHQFNEHLFRKHIVFNENQFFPNFFLGFPMVSRRKKFTSQPPQLLRSFPWSFISGPWLTKKSMQVLISVLQLAPAASTASAQAST